MDEFKEISSKDGVTLSGGKNFLILDLHTNETNSITPEAVKEIRKILGSISSKDSNKVLILRSTNQNYFSNGLAPEAFYNKKEAEIESLFSEILNCAREYFFLPCVTVSLVQGYCIGAGAVFAIFSDYRYFSESGRISFPEILIGMNFPSISFSVLSSIVGSTTAKELLFSGKSLKSEQAKTLQLADDTFLNRELEETIQKLERKFQKYSVQSVKAIKAATKKGFEAEFRDNFNWDIQSTVETILGNNAQEGFLSIIEKRKPNFKD